MSLFNHFERIMEKIESLLDEQSIECFKGLKFSELHIEHLGLGMIIRNKMLYNNNTLLELFYKSGITDVDDMSALLVELFYIYIKQKYS